MIICHCPTALSKLKPQTQNRLCGESLVQNFLVSRNCSHSSPLSLIVSRSLILLSLSLVVSLTRGLSLPVTRCLSHSLSVSLTSLLSFSTRSPPSAHFHNGPLSLPSLTRCLSLTKSLSCCRSLTCCLSHCLVISRTRRRDKRLSEGGVVYWCGIGT